VAAIHVVLTLEEVYAEPVPINAQKMTDIRRLASYIPDEHRNIWWNISEACMQYGQWSR
jgi:hypothetical protein